MVDRPAYVLHIVPMLSVGGMELVMARVIKELSFGDMRHSIVCLKGDAVIGDLFDESVSIYCLHSGSNDISLPGRLWRLIRRIRPTVIHARNWGAWPDVALARLMMLSPAPLIFSFHGLDTSGPMPFRRRLACRMLAGITTRIFTVSEASRRMLAEQVGIPARRIAVIPNGVDTDKFKPCPARPVDGRIVIGTVGSLTPVKNQSLLIRAFAHLVTTGSDVELRLAGHGPKQEELMRLAGELGVKGRTIFAGHVDDIPAFLRGLNVFVLPSDTEAHPNALLEAMACGLPCVATRVGGVQEVLRQGEVGMIIEPQDQTALEQALTELIEQPVLRSELGKAARARVCERYSKERMVDAYASMYRDLSRTAACRRRR